MDRNFAALGGSLQRIGYWSHGHLGWNSSCQMCWEAREEMRMPVILVKCPIDGREFSTGIFTDIASFGTLGEVEARARCPHCGREHRWWTSQSRLADSVPLAGLEKRTALHIRRGSADLTRAQPSPNHR